MGKEGSVGGGHNSQVTLSAMVRAVLQEGQQEGKYWLWLLSRTWLRPLLSVQRRVYGSSVEYTLGNLVFMSGVNNCDTETSVASDVDVKLGECDWNKEILCDAKVLVMFFFSCGGVRLSPLGTSVNNWPIVPAPGGRWWWMWGSRWNENWQGKPK
jgi:hypothetical protein